MSPFNLASLLQYNPQADKKIIDEANDLLKSLEDNGIPVHTYNLESPFADRVRSPRSVATGASGTVPTEGSKLRSRSPKAT